MCSSDLTHTHDCWVARSDTLTNTPRIFLGVATSHNQIHRFTHDSLFLLSFAGFDVVTLANNHFNDFGSEGVNFTVDVLKRTGVKYFGVTYGKYDSSQVQ